MELSDTPYIASDGALPFQPTYEILSLFFSFFFSFCFFSPASFYFLSYALLSSCLDCLFLFNTGVSVERSARYDQLICS
ncbi:hypothetical protein BDV33DRAFT_38230 [Aspergillus novoparasiticus]|uniref:Uncharacterized protein n=1 Tax=Aspergillus novoparasiticus TaxID=986946 RepID=A0A5N6E9I4_9EURO|nr:hypothetical protein BDV33DRAFT_38230 [Aspergillus novoparasiticus]